MIFVVDVEKWLFVNRQEADEANVPTILVEKDHAGAKRFTSMRNLFQLKKWTTHRRFIPLLFCDEASYRFYEVFHVDAKPSMVLLDGGRTLLVDNVKDEAYDSAIHEIGRTSADSILQFALEYVEGHTGQSVVFAGEGDHQSVVPIDVYDNDDRLDSGRRLFEWMNQQAISKESRYD